MRFLIFICFPIHTIRLLLAKCIFRQQQQNISHFFFYCPFAASGWICFEIVLEWYEILFDGPIHLTVEKKEHDDH